jgi:hypothetical protein
MIRHSRSRGSKRAAPAALVVFLAAMLCHDTAIADTQAVGALCYDFAGSDHGFSAIFADYPPAQAPIYFLTADRRARPANLGGAPALFISGVNRSDDLFMAWKRQVAGLRPSTDYLLTFEIEFASKYATGLVGVGGAPGDGVALKAGAVAFEPLAVLTGSYLRMNLDKDSGGNRFGGADMPTLGTIAKPADGNFDYVILTRSNHGQPLTARTSSDGKLWLIFGTDSGFEAETALYYSRLKVWISPVAEPALWMEKVEPSALRLLWHGGLLQTNTDLTNPPGWTDVPSATTPLTFVLPADSARFWRARRP